MSMHRVRKVTKVPVISQFLDGTRFGRDRRKSLPEDICYHYRYNHLLHYAREWRLLNCGVGDLK